MMYTVLSVAPNPHQWGDPPNGPFLDYTVRFAEHADKDVGWSRKVSSDAPTVGQSVDGTIDWNAKVRPKFKQEYQNKGGGGSTWKPKDPAEIAAIQRQASLKIAVQIATAAGWWNDFDPEDASGKAKLKLFSRLTTWIQRDIQKGVEVAAQDTAAKASYGKVKEPVQTGQSDLPSLAPDEFVAPEPSKAENEMWATT